MALWTYQHIKELGRQRAKARAQSRHDIRIIHIPARIGRSSHDVDLERRINSQAQGVPTDEAPPYESIANTTKDIE